jgi:choice-of-anchor B domain-containing protein
MKSSTFFSSVIKKIFFVGFLSLLFFLPNQTLAQLNVDSLSHINYQQLHAANLNDVWGYVDELGNEYALVGTSKGTSIVDVTDPANPVEVFWLPGSESIWRDPSSFGDYAYVTTEAEDGMLIIDLGPLPQSTNLTTTLYTGPTNNPWQSAHTCFVDEFGYAYVFGANRGNGGVIMLDVFTNPMAPIEVGVFDNWYCHDGYVRNDTMYLSHIYDGFLSIVDVSNKAIPQLLGTKTTPGSFTHNSWPSANGQFVFTTDEVSGAFIAAYDISDPTNIVEVDRIQNSPGSGVLPHNTHVMGDYLITSYYSDGIVVHDITYPYNMIKVGQYDTYVGQTVSFDGCWGVYPFFPSGTTVAADITNGLFVLGPQYEKASYLEGDITDANTTLALQNVAVHILPNDQTDYSAINGHYATGMLIQGSVQVEYSKVGYFPVIETVNLLQGQITIHDVQLVPIAPFNFTVVVTEQGTGNLISNAQIKLVHPLIEHLGITNGIGEEDFVLFYQQNYRVHVGKWGYRSICFDTVIDQNTGVLAIELPLGYYDDFEFDFGWGIVGAATTGSWERGIPNPTSSGSAIGDDASFDCGTFAYLTGNDINLHPDFDDLDQGETILTSPPMDLSAYTNPYFNYSRGFYCYYGPYLVDDTLKIYASNGTTTVLIDQVGAPQGNSMAWESKSIALLGLLPITNSMQISIHISDEDPNVNITEAAFDYFTVTNSNVAEVLVINKATLFAYPVPMNDKVNLVGLTINQDLRLFDATGQLLANYMVNSENMTFDLSAFQNKVFIFVHGNQTLKVMKM